MGLESNKKLGRALWAGLYAASGTESASRPWRVTIPRAGAGTQAGFARLLEKARHRPAWLGYGNQ